MRYYTIQDAAELVGVSYNRLWYALITGKLRASRRIGRLRIFDDCDIEGIREYFTGRKQGVEPT